MIKEFKVIIAGSRTFYDFQMLCDYCDKILKEKSKTHRIIIIEGGAKGADALGRKYAEQRGYDCETFEADWKDFSEPCVIKENAYGKYNALAGHNRNQKMAELADALIAFNKGTSGTNDMVSRAKKHGLLVREILIN